MLEKDTEKYHISCLSYLKTGLITQMVMQKDRIHPKQKVDNRNPCFTCNIFLYCPCMQREHVYMVGYVMALCAFCVWSLFIFLKAEVQMRGKFEK